MDYWVNTISDWKYAQSEIRHSKIHPVHQVYVCKQHEECTCQLLDYENQIITIMTKNFNLKHTGILQNGIAKDGR